MLVCNRLHSVPRKGLATTTLWQQVLSNLCGAVSVNGWGQMVRGQPKRARTIASARIRMMRRCLACVLTSQKNHLRSKSRALRRFISRCWWVQIIVEKKRRTEATCEKGYRTARATHSVLPAVHATATQMLLCRSRVDSGALKSQ